MSATICPEPGIYPDVAAEIYHGWDAASNSRLSTLKRSPAHLRAELDVPREDTPAFLIGRAVHAAILEPDTFVSEFVRAPECDRRTKAGKATWERFQAENANRTVLSAADYRLCESMRDSVRAHASAGHLVTAAGDSELSFTWDDQESGQRCKARADKLCGALDVVVDVKSTQDASPDAFTRSIFNFGYHRQAAMYLDGLAMHGVKARHFVFIAVEKTAPFAVGVYRLTDDAVEAGRQELRKLLALFRQCAERGEWPGYGDDIQDISLPRWAWSQIEQGI